LSRHPDVSLNVPTFAEFALRSVTLRWSFLEIGNRDKNHRPCPGI